MPHVTTKDVFGMKFGMGIKFSERGLTGRLVGDG